MNVTLNEICAMYPRESTNKAVTGRIPIAFSNRHENALRELMRGEGLRAIFRGPRKHYGGTGKASTTARCDATAVLLYRK